MMNDELERKSSTAQAAKNRKVAQFLQTQLKRKQAIYLSFASLRLFAAWRLICFAIPIPLVYEVTIPDSRFTAIAPASQTGRGLPSTHARVSLRRVAESDPQPLELPLPRQTS